MKRYIKTSVCLWGAFLCLLCMSPLYGQPTPLTLDSCRAWARQHYPLVAQYDLLKKTSAYSLENANKGYLPRIQISGQASYQSEVTQIPASIPGLDIPTLSNDQYRLYGELNQPITDLFTVKKQKKIIETDSKVETQKLEVALAGLHERIDQLFFGLLLLEAQQEQVGLLKKEIDIGLDKTEAAIANGVALESSAAVLRAEALRADQRLVTLEANRKSYADMLALFTGRPISVETPIERPLVIALPEGIKRPELALYGMQKEALAARSKLITAGLLPRFSLFFQGGVGRPALNMLSNDLSEYYIGGLRLNWNLSAFYTSGKERETIALRQRMVDAQQETFLFNTRLTLSKQRHEVSRLQALVDLDRDIVKLRESITQTARDQLANGAATSNDYLTQVNAEDRAKKDLLMHEIQLLKAYYTYRTTTGN